MLAWQFFSDYQVHARLDRTDGRLDEHATTIEANRAAIAREAEVNKEQETALTKLGERVVTLERDAEKSVNRLESMEDRLWELEDIKELKKQLEHLAKARTRDQEMLAGLRRSIELLEEDRKLNRDRLAAIERKLGLTPEP